MNCENSMKLGELDETELVLGNRHWIVDFVGYQIKINISILLIIIKNVLIELH